MVSPKLPIEIINVILEYADTRTVIYYDSKIDGLFFRFCKENDEFKKIEGLYNNRKIDVFENYNGYRQTQICYNIGMKKIPSWYERMDRFEHAKSYMIIVVEEDKENNTLNREHHISSVISFQNGDLLLN